MRNLHYEPKRILIWGKTGIELSRKDYETVCTGGVTEDGKPIRLYPIPHRYLDSEDQFKKYQWITARVARDPSDPRPESHHVERGSIEAGEVIPTDDYEWGNRADVMFRDQSWQFKNVEGPGGLLEAQARDGTSIGVVDPREILRVELYTRPSEDRDAFEAKKQELIRKNEIERAQGRLFDEFMPPQMKDLAFASARYGSAGCATAHGLQGSQHAGPGLGGCRTIAA